MANYNLYENINEESLSSAANELLGKISECKSSLINFSAQLTDKIWKASAKQTLLTAFSQIESEIYNDLQNQLQAILKIAVQIQSYKKNESSAKSSKTTLGQNETKLAKAIYATTKASLNRNISILKANIKTYESNMDYAEDAISSLSK